MYEIKGFVGMMSTYINFKNETDQYLAHQFFDIMMCLCLPIDDIFCQCEEDYE